MKAPPSTPTGNPGKTIQPITPAPAPPTPAKPEPGSVEAGFTYILMRANDKLQFGDGAGCLKLLATLPEVPHDSMVGVEQIRISCRMATGDCVGAAAAMQKLGKAQGWDEPRVKTMTEAADRHYCPITSEPKTRWAERAQHKLAIASGMGRSCKPILETIAKHNIVLPDPKGFVFLEIQCLVNVGDCAAAKTKYINHLIPANIDPTRRPDFEESNAKSFHNSYKKCP